MFVLVIVFALLLVLLVEVGAEFATRVGASLEFARGHLRSSKQEFRDWHSALTSEYMVSLLSAELTLCCWSQTFAPLWPKLS